MSDGEDAAAKGPVEAFAFPTALSAHAVEPGARPRLHGYDVQGDLARRYSFAETVLCALAGEAPSREAGRAFEAAMTFLSPIPVSEAPAHAALLTRLCGASDAAVIAAGAIAAAERAAWMIREDANRRARGAATSHDDDDAVGRLLEAAGIDAPWPDGERPPLDGAILAVLRWCGLESDAQLTTAITIASLATSGAEAFAVKPASFRDYPMDLPRFVYEGETDER